MKSNNTAHTAPDDEILISIVIPAYNSGKYLDDCLDSCFNQDLDEKRYEIIIVNDGSNDNTLQIAEEWASRHSNIIVLSQENKGLSMARNAGIESAAGKYIMFLDSDDRIAVNCMGKIAESLRYDAPDMLRFCAANIIDGMAQRRFSYRHTEPCAGKDLLKDNFQVCAPFAAYRKAFLDDYTLRFFPDVYHEDNEFTPRAYYFAHKVVSIDDILYFVRQTPCSITRTANPKRGYDLLKISRLLTNFADSKVEEGYRQYIYKQIADCINRALSLMNELSEEEADRLRKEILKNKDIFHLMRCSSRITHRVEGWLLSIFPKRMKMIYNTLDIIHR